MKAKPLKQIILDRGLTIQQAAKELRINKHYLCSVANGIVPGGRYLRAYLEQWAGEPIQFGSSTVDLRRKPVAQRPQQEAEVA